MDVVEKMGLNAVLHVDMPRANVLRLIYALTDALAYENGEEIALRMEIVEYGSDASVYIGQRNGGPMAGRGTVVEHSIHLD